MNASLDRKLERLAREIAAAKAPRLDAAANAQFKQLSQSHSSKSPSDWNSKDGTKRTLINGAAQVLLSESQQAAPASVEKANPRAANSASGHAVVTSEAAPPSAQGDGWIEWTHGEPPVSPDTVVRVRCKSPWNSRESGEVDVKASGVVWTSRRVIAYRLVPQ